MITKRKYNAGDFVSILDTPETRSRKGRYKSTGKHNTLPDEAFGSVHQIFGAITLGSKGYAYRLVVPLSDGDEVTVWFTEDSISPVNDATNELNEFLDEW